LKLEGTPILRAALICPDRNLADQLQSALAPLPVALVRLLDHYPPEADLLHLLRSVAPQAILLSVENLQAAVEVARDVERLAPGTQVLAIGGTSSQQVLLEMMRVGVREFLAAPFDGDNFTGAIGRAQGSAERSPRSTDLTEDVFSFLPAKAGVGATTIALNLSVALSRRPQMRVLLADFDLSSGLIGFMLKLDPRYSVTSAADNAFQLDEALWRQLVSSSGSLDVLPVGKIQPSFRIEPPQIRSILDFARRQYKAICFDLSGNMEKYSVEVMHESKRVYLICTAELPALHLAREKLSFLRAAELEDRVRVVVNRSTKRDAVSPAEIEKLLGLPVDFIFPNDYKGVHKAVASGKPVEADTELGKKFRLEAEAMLSGSKPPDVRNRRFVEYFSLLPARYSVSPAEKG
jgi:pilus assembly protein CpaE